MAEEFTFSHITVTPHEEEETVIHVGSSHSAGTSSSISVEASASGTVAVSADGTVAVAEEAVVEEARVDGPSIVVQEAASPAATPAPGASAAAPETASPGASAAAPETASPGAPAAAPANTPSAAREELEKHAEDNYRETTLEDLDNHPMSLTHKIVIIAAVLLLVGFAVYYIFAM